MTEQERGITIQAEQEEVLEPTLPELVTDGRRLVTIRKVDEIQSIAGADFIQLAVVDGWTTIIKKGEFEVGDFGVFFEIDSFLPASDDRFAFLLRNGTKMDENEVPRIRLRSMKMKGVLSQGLLLPTKMFTPELTNIDVDLEVLEDTRNGIEQFINVTKYERPSERNGGNTGVRALTGAEFPIMIPKTDEDRIQNVYGRLAQRYGDVTFARSLKLDGSSTTLAFFNNPEFFVEKMDKTNVIRNEETGEIISEEVVPYPYNYDECQVLLCSRNLVLKHEPENNFWKAMNNDDIISRFKDYCFEHSRQLAIQGETMGEGIQGNREKLTQHKFYAFRVWDIDNRQFLNHNDFIELCEVLDIETVPQLGTVKFFEEYKSINEALASAEHESINHKIAEGDVYKSVDTVDGITVHFKVINNQFLLKCED